MNSYTKSVRETEEAISVQITTAMNVLTGRGLPPWHTVEDSEATINDCAQRIVRLAARLETKNFDD